MGPDGAYTFKLASVAAGTVATNSKNDA